MVVSLALSGGLVYAAEYYTKAPDNTLNVSTSQTAISDDSNWQATLSQIEAQNASAALTPPDPNTVSALLQAAQSDNVTQSVGRKLLVSLSNAKSQGLGDDIPTQNELIAAANSQVQQGSASSTLYTVSQLTVVSVSSSTLHAYGNGLIETLNRHPEASEHTTLLAIGYANDTQDKTQLEKLPPIGAAYRTMATELLALPVPQTLAPFHLQVVNDYFKIAASYADMHTLLADPLRGMVGLQNYESLMDEEGRMFINIAQTLNKDGILFTKDEPGSAWGVFLASP
jgi:hypothetical protein